MDSRTRLSRYWIPSLLSLALVIADQLSKAWIVSRVPLNTIHLRLFDDFLWIVHTRNLGIAFSIGDSVPGIVRLLLFILLPLGFIIGAITYFFRSTSLSLTQRYAVAFIVAGGSGNLLDRIFRAEGVVDFLSFSLFGLFGLERFPTFNIADTAINVGAALILITGFFFDRKISTSISEDQVLPPTPSTLPEKETADEDRS
jgi:signal peptidase II